MDQSMKIISVKHKQIHNNSHRYGHSENQSRVTSPPPQIKKEEPVTVLSTVSTSRYLPGWSISANNAKIIYKSSGFVLNRNHNRYKEQKKTTTKKKKKKTPIQTRTWGPYTDTRFTDWQAQFSREVHQGKNVILNIATSCGKTWVNILTVTYETLMSDTHTAIFVSPNAEVLRENIEDIKKGNIKNYITLGRSMADTRTRSFSTYDTNKSPMCQIMCLTTQNFSEFVTNELNHEFVNNLKYLVFDEVHLPEVSNSVYWSKFIPHSARYMLLSATLGDTEEAIKTLVSVSQGPIKVITHDIRPIPLQRVLFKGCEFPENGIACKTLKGAGRMSCQINPFDPTKRDILSYCKIKKEAFPQELGSRESQYSFGVKRMTKDLDFINTQIENDLTESVTNPTSENLFKLLSYIFSNQMQPALVFNTSSAETRSMAEKLVGFISQLEESDEEFKKARKFNNKENKDQKKERDQDVKIKRVRGTGTSRINRNATVKNKGFNADNQELDDNEKDYSILLKLSKWKFPMFETGLEGNRGVPFWVQNCLEYGIGVYTKNFPKWLRYKIFDAYKDGKIQVLISDISLSIGINLPARSCILCGDIDETLYRQMGGRSGRRGFDNKGFVIPMFSKPMIRKCLTCKATPVSISLPNSLNICDLVRLQTPLFLELYTTNTGGKKEIISLIKKQKFDETLKSKTLANYKSSLTASQMEDYLEITKYIKQRKWQVHRLTNIIKRLDYNETLIFMQMLINGDLQFITADDFINLISVLFEREVITTTLSIKLKTPLLDKVIRYGKIISRDIDFSKPINNYFTRFCKHGEYNVKYLDRIDRIGNWIYVLKKHVSKVAPRKDKFLELLNSVDSLYLASCKRNSL